MPDDNVSNCTASPRHNSARAEAEITMVDEHSHEHPERNEMKDRGKRSEGCSLLVRNLRYETSPARVRRLFERYGDVRDVYLPLDYYTRRPRGFGFVEFYEVADADKAARELDGHVLDGNDIHVVIAHDRRKSPETMRQLQRDGKSIGKFKPKGSFRFGGRDDRRDRYDDRRERYDDRRERYDDRRERYDDRRERYDDRRDRYDDRRDRYDRRERYDERYCDKDKVDVERRRRYDRSRSEERYRGFQGSEDRTSSHSSYCRGRKPTRSNSRQRSRSSHSGSHSRYKNPRGNEKSYSPRRPRSRSRSRSYSGNGK